MKKLRMHRMAQQIYTLRNFIKDEMDRRKMSIRAFADLMGVAHTTVSRVIDEQEPAQPSLEFLTKLSNATKKDLASLVELAYPDVAEKTRPSASSIVMAQRFEELSDDGKRMILMLLRSQ